MNKFTLLDMLIGDAQGYWLYSLDRNEERLVMHVAGGELGSAEDELRKKLLSLRL